MNLRLADVDFEINIDSKHLNFLVIENTDLFFKILITIHSAIQGNNSAFSLTSNNQELDCGKTLELITDPIALTLDDGLFKKELLKMIVAISDQSKSAQILSDINQGVAELIEGIDLDMPFEIEYNYEFGLKDLCTAFRVRVKPLEGSFLERLIEYIKIVHRLTEKSLFIIANCCDLMNSDSFLKFEESCKYEGVMVLFLDAHQCNKEIEIRETIIDNDLCEI